MDDDLLSIGWIARLCGLSVGALRHDDGGPSIRAGRRSRGERRVEARAVAELSKIADAEDRKVLEQDIATLR